MEKMMSNMSYCRFQNTSDDLEDCRDALMNRIEGTEGKLSRDELHAAKRLASIAAVLLMALVEAGGIDLEAEVARHGDLSHIDFDGAVELVNEGEG
jgi:hypothetical protein